MTATRLLYVDAVAGVAGDMLLAALIDAGAPVEAVRAGLERLGIAGLGLEVERTERHGLAAARVRVTAPDTGVQRDWEAVRALVDRAGLSSRAHARAHEAFRRLAHAEARVHRVHPDRVHFHEVGGLDALADVCGVALALEALDVDSVACSPLPVGRGLVRAAHGVLPLPAPATLELTRGVPLEGVEADVELVTPTGAALVTALAEDRFGPLPPMRLEQVGYGAGERELRDRPNVVRVLIGTSEPALARRAAVLIECTLDDLSGELVADAAAACLESGALDAWLTPVQMKKGRPEHEPRIVEAMARHSTTLGVRTVPVSRWELDREHLTVEIDGQAIAVKLGLLGGEVVNVAPEHDDVARAAAELERPAKTVWAQAWAAAERALAGRRRSP